MFAYYNTGVRHDNPPRECLRKGQTVGKIASRFANAVARQKSTAIRKRGRRPSSDGKNPKSKSGENGKQRGTS